MSHVLENVTFNYLSDVDVPLLEQRLIIHLQKRMNKINSRKQNRNDKKQIEENF